MKSAVTVCLVPEMAAGPFVFHGDLAAAVRTAADLGFDAVEVFAGSAAELRALDLPRVLARTGLAVAAVGTGAGFVRHKLTLSDPDATGRAAAVAFVRDFIDAAADLGCPAIVGSMQGRAGASAARSAALDRLAESLAALAGHAASRGQVVLFEPLNRYESDLVNTLADGADLFARAGSPAGGRLLADLFHMNIEETSLATALLAAGPLVGHVHLADSNRLPAGTGHTAFAPVAAALREAGYAGYLSAEVFPRPDAVTAARQSVDAFRLLTRDAA